MKVNILDVGPILGEVTSNQVKIFGRGNPQFIDSQLRRAHLVVHCRQAGRSNWQPTHYFKLNPNFDMSAVAVLDDLSPNHSYEYQCGYVYSDVGSEIIDIESVLEWSEVPINCFSTASSNKNDARTIVTGSCRYILKLFGGRWFDDRGDKTFRSIMKEHGNNKDIDLVLMSGDQIYADDLNILGADNTIDEYFARYRLAFSQPHISNMMANIPTLMTLDDHEIENNWPENASSKDLVTKYPIALHAYQVYQASHSPLSIVVNGRIGAVHDRLWYSHRDGCCDIFVTDSRTERELEPNRKIMSDVQMKALKKWLTDGSGLVKIIVTSVPPWESESRDKWHGFIDQRDELLSTIADKSVPKVLFLSGDVHASMGSQINLGTVKVTSIVSSAFFWPYPHPNAKDFKLDGSIKTNKGTNWTISGKSSVIATDSFSRIHITNSGVDMRIIGRKGSKRTQKKYQW